MPTRSKASLNADQLSALAQTPLEDQQTKSLLIKEAYKNYLESLDLYDKKVDQFPSNKRVPAFNASQIRGLERLKNLPEVITAGNRENRLPNLIREGHNYAAMTPATEQRMNREAITSPLERDEYEQYVQNPHFQKLIKDYQDRSAERFKDEMLPATRSYYASRGAYNTSSRAAAEQIALKKHTERENRDIMKMISEMQPQAAEYALQSHLAERSGMQNVVNNRQLNKQSYLNSANALQANQANDIANQVKASQADMLAGDTEEARKLRQIAEEKSHFENHVREPERALRTFTENVHQLPVTHPSTITGHVPAAPERPNPYSAASGVAQLMASAGGNNPLTQANNLPAMAEGGQVPSSPQSSQAIPDPHIPQTGAYTPEQSILLQMVQNFQKQHPLNRMLQTTGANTLANLRGDPIEAFGEGMLKHIPIEQENQKNHADVLHKLDDSRQKQHRLLAEMGIKTRELNIDEKYKTDLIGARREEVASSKALNAAHAQHYQMDSLLKQQEFDKMKGRLGTQNAISNFGESPNGQISGELETPQISRTSSPLGSPIGPSAMPESEPSSGSIGPLAGQIEPSSDQSALPPIHEQLSPPQEGQKSPSASLGASNMSTPQNLNEQNSESFNPEAQIENARQQLAQIKQMRAAVGGSDLKDADKTIAHQELEKARELKRISGDGLDILKRMNELNSNLTTGSIPSRFPEIPFIGNTGGINKARALNPFEKGTTAERDRFDQLSNDLVKMETSLDDLGGGTGKRQAGIGVVQFNQSRKPAGNKATQANAEAIADYANRYQKINDKNSFIVKASTDYMLTPSEAATIYEKLEDQGVNPMDIFASKKKNKHETQKQPTSISSVDSEIARLEKKLGKG